jgi:cytochrome c biogenesis protein CcmG/thiol:disulfide interchange protein DsbE
MFRTTGVPETYILDRQGKLAFVKKGPFQSIGEITAVIDELVK